MPSHPWLDIMSEAEFAAALEAYRAGRLRSLGTTQRMRDEAGRGPLPVPRALVDLARQVHEYHALAKTDEENIADRGEALEQISRAARHYLVSVGVMGPADPRSRRYPEFVQTLEFVVSTLAERAMEKAAYIQILIGFLREHYEGLARPDQFIRHLIETTRRGPTEVSLVPGVRLERLDPLHRVTEVRLVPRGAPAALVARTVVVGTDVTAPGVDPSVTAAGMQVEASPFDVMGRALATWFELFRRRPAVPPFFIWLEGHPMCTGAVSRPSGAGVTAVMGVTATAHAGPGGSGSWHEAHSDSWDAHSSMPLGSDSSGVGDQPVTVVRYEDPRQEEVDGFVVVPAVDVYLVTAERGRLMLVDLAGAATGQPARRFDTRGAAHDRDPGCWAFAWSSDGAVYSAPHRGGEFHHSSFTGGATLQCAGMIGADGGKVTRLSNHSGHYRPHPWHLHRLATRLHALGVFHDRATVRLVGVDAAGQFFEHRMGIREFLASAWGQQPPELAGTSPAVGATTVARPPGAGVPLPPPGTGAPLSMVATLARMGSGGPATTAADGTRRRRRLAGGTVDLLAAMPRDT